MTERYIPESAVRKALERAFSAGYEAGTHDPNYEGWRNSRAPEHPTERLMRDLLATAAPQEEAPRECRQCGGLGLTHSSDELGTPSVCPRCEQRGVEPAPEPEGPTWWKLRQMIMDSADKMFVMNYERRSAEAEALTNWIQAQYARPAAAEGVESREENLGWVQINADGVPVEAESGEPLTPDDLWMFDQLPARPGRWSINVRFTLLASDDGEQADG
jgi:hypothetical protein